MVKLNKKLIGKIASEATSNDERYKKMSVYSRPVAIVLRYHSITVPQFSMGGAATEILTEAVKQQYPEIWEALDSIEEKSKERLPDTIEFTDSKAWEKAIEETKTRGGKMFNIFSPRTVSVIRYLAKTTPRFKCSTEVARIIEEALAKRYPDVWAKVSDAIN